MKMHFYETHLHTAEASACGRTPGEQYPAAYKKLGYSGIFVTDHFFNGNCGVPRDLPWEERVDRYCSGYEHAYEAGKKIDFDVFFGLEVNFEGDEYLLYGPDKQWLKAHPDIMIWSRAELHEEVHKIGGLMVQAHPYRDRDYLNAIRVHPECSDAFEGHNTFNSDYSDQYAYAYSVQNGIKMTSGSDIHRVSDTDTHRLGGVCFEKKLTSSKDYASRILSARGSVPIFGDDDLSHIEGDIVLPENTYGFVTYEDRRTPDKNTVFSKPFRIADKDGNEQNIDASDTIDWGMI